MIIITTAGKVGSVDPRRRVQSEIEDALSRLSPRVGPSHKEGTNQQKGHLMTTNKETTGRTEHLLALMTRGDDLFNARDWQVLDDVHHPDMIAFIPGSAEPIYGRTAHGAAMRQLVRMFPDVRVHTPYPIQFGGDNWITVVTNATGTFTGEMTLPDGNVIPPTGKAFDLEFAQTSKWDGDQLIVISAFWDTAAQRQQIGLA
jgi:SnoaL-like polyketide cyclase